MAVTKESQTPLVVEAPPKVAPLAPPRSIHSAPAPMPSTTVRRPRPQRSMKRLLYDQPGWLTSMLLHLLLLLVMAMLFTRADRIPKVLTLSFAAADEALDFSGLQFEPAGAIAETSQDHPLNEAIVDVVRLPEFNVAAVTELAMLPPTIDANLTQIVAGSMVGLSGRSGRRGNAQDRGATPGSEAAVDRALVWLAAHQQRTGRWSFDLANCNCQHCRNRGTSAISFNAATGLALLPFLGAGQTHERGYHRAKVKTGLNYLLKHQGKDGGFYEPHGRMYSHGIATLAICEALAMTRTDPGAHSSTTQKRQPRLRRAAQRAINFTAKAQHVAGGWRYQYRQPGDTSVVGWQMMALQSAKMAGLKVSQQTFDRAAEFLNSVQGDSYGGLYGYLAPGGQPGTTSIGLLTRMYLGWDRTHPGIMAGVANLVETGHSANNVYYNYYATQVMHHYQGREWKNWHPRLRDHLVATQSRSGHEDGSWYFEGDHGSSVAGRLYITSMSTMILEVYYRHMPVYSEQAIATPQLLGQQDR